MEWGITPGEWYKLPRWERAAMVAASIARSLLESAALEKVNA